MTDTIAYILIAPLAVLVLLSAFFSGSETAYSSVPYTKVAIDATAGKKTSKLIEKHYKAFGKTLSTILICNNLVNVVSSALITMVISHFITNNLTVMIVSTFVMTPIIVAFGEITPKLFAKKYSYGYLKKVVYVMEFLNILLLPLTYPISKMTLQAKVTNTENELKSIIGLAAEEGVLEKREATLAQNALDLDSTKVSSIFTKREDVISIKEHSSIKDAKTLFKDSGHSRIPVTRSGKYIGVIIIKDIVFVTSGDINAFIHKVPIVSKTTNTTKALETLRRSNSHIGFVTQTNSSTKILGILTLEDIVEELIGEIYDEHDKKDSILQVGLHKYIANGSASMIKLGKDLKFDFEIDEDMKIKRWLQSRINRTIKTGLVYKYKNKITFKVISNKNGHETSIEITQK